MTIPNRAFGVELEFNNAPPPEVVAWLLCQKGLKAYDEDNIPPCTKKHSYWLIHDDSSITGPAIRMEMSSPIFRGKEGLAEVRAVCRQLTKLGCKTNASCGLHVHVSDSRLTNAALVTVLRRYAENEDLIDSWMAKSRRESRNGSCRSHRRDWKDMAICLADPEERRCIYRDRWEVSSGINGCKINFDSDYPTLEFRHHHGTLNPTEVSHWVQFCLNFVEVSADLAPGTRRATKRIRDTGPLMGLPTGVRNHFKYQAERLR